MALVTDVIVLVHLGGVLVSRQGETTLRINQILSANFYAVLAGRGVVNGVVLTISSSAT